MAQLTIYLDKETAAKVEAAAQREGDSLSKWARKHLAEAASSGDWPRGYWEMFEDRADGSFREPEELDIATDVRRVGL